MRIRPAWLVLVAGLVCFGHPHPDRDGPNTLNPNDDLEYSFEGDTASPINKINMDDRSSLSTLTDREAYDILPTCDFYEKNPCIVTSDVQPCRACRKRVTSGLRKWVMGSRSGCPKTPPSSADNEIYSWVFVSTERTIKHEDGSEERFALCAVEHLSKTGANMFAPAPVEDAKSTNKYELLDSVEKIMGKELRPQKELGSLGNYLHSERGRQNAAAIPASNMPAAALSAGALHGPGGKPNSAYGLTAARWSVVFLTAAIFSVNL